MSRNPSDATPVHRGYRLQAQYTLWRILGRELGPNIAFQPETYEDLAIYDDDELIEVVQVKSSDRDLTLSALVPDNPGSFFPRAAALLKQYPSLQVHLVVFGTVGSELKQAVGPNAPRRDHVVAKLTECGTVSREDACNLLEKIIFTELAETQIHLEVLSLVRQCITGIDPKPAFDLLTEWSRGCAERKTRVKRSNLIRELQAVGSFLADRLAYHREWFTTIEPIDDQAIDEVTRGRLSDEFYEGIWCRYEHVLADLDVARPEKLAEIEEKLAKSRIVVIHGVSGQGKSTLAYRYLRDYFPGAARYRVKAIENRQHALSIATALQGYARAMELPFAIYIDVRAADSDWPELVKELSSHDGIRILVTIREEDFRRSSISGAEIRFQGIELSLTRMEALGIYESLVAKRKPANFLSFDESWSRFGEEGPLLEFVHLVTQGETLRARLSDQVSRLQDDVRTHKLDPGELELLRLIAVASSFEARLVIKPLLKEVDLAEPQRTFDLLEREYLVRRSPDGTVVEGLHPIRSSIIAELLTEPELCPWSAKAVICVRAMRPDDLEIFLLFAFSRRPSDRAFIVEWLRAFHPEEWFAIAGTLRSLLWLGIREYVESNHQLISDAFSLVGNGWRLALDFDITDCTPDTATSVWSELEGMAAEGVRSNIEMLRSRQTDKSDVFSFAAAWLTSRKDSPSFPKLERDWRAVGEVAYWLGHCSRSWPLSKWVTDNQLAQCISEQSIETLSLLVRGVSRGAAQFYERIAAQRAVIISRFREETNTVAIEDDGAKITAHFIVSALASGENDGVVASRLPASSDPLHNKAMSLARLLAGLVPEHSTYACFGYGHRVWNDELPYDFDSTHKEVSRNVVPPEWATGHNATFLGLGTRQFRPEDWREYVNSVMQIREAIVNRLTELDNALSKHFASQAPINLISEIIDADLWIDCGRLTRQPPLLPMCAVDEWGFVDEFRNNSQTKKSKSITSGGEIWSDSETTSPVLRYGLSMIEYKPFLTAYGDCTFHLSNFFSQSMHLLALNPWLGRASFNQLHSIREVAQREGIDENYKRLSVVNLADAGKNLCKMQTEFRRLFAHLVDLADLASLEDREYALLEEIWPMWYAFAFRPHQTIFNARVTCADRMQGLLGEMRKRMDSVLKEFSSDEASLRVLTDEATWEGERTLWIGICGDNAVGVYNALAIVLDAVRKSLPSATSTELKFWVRDFYWPYIVVVPIVRGLSINKQAWRFYTAVLTDHTEFGWWNFGLHGIPGDAWQDIGLGTWELPRLEVSNLFWKSCVELSILTGHIRDFKRLPELDEQGFDLLQRHVSTVSDRITSVLQPMINAASTMLSTMNETPDNELDHRPNLIRAIEELRNFTDAALRIIGENGEAVLNFDRLAEWADTLQATLAFAHLAYLFWATDVIDESILQS